MSAAQTEDSEILSGMCDRSHLEKVFKKTARTIIRYERAGMPFIAVGNLRLYDPTKVRDWILSHESRPAEPPRRGRPRNLATT